MFLVGVKVRLAGRIEQILMKPMYNTEYAAPNTWLTKSVLKVMFFKLGNLDTKLKTRKW